MRRIAVLVTAVGVVATAVVGSFGVPLEASLMEHYNRRQQTTTSPIHKGSHLISVSGMGRLRLGMTLAEARRTHPTARFTRTSDGDGAALVEVSVAPNESLILSTHEEDPELPIDWSKKIRSIETFSSAFYTVGNVRAGSLVTDVERVYGDTKEIVRSEIESREYIEFERQPAYLTLRLNYTGIFSAGERTTMRFQPGAKILSITVSSSPQP